MNKNQASKYLIVIYGPTAVGKTSVSIALAKHFDAEIFSADSRQIYKELTIGTAKASDDELSQVKHHFINYLSVNDKYDAGTYEEDCLASLAKYFEDRSIAVLTGGTNLYIKAVTDGFDKFPEIEKSTVEKVRLASADYELIKLQELLKEHDPAYFKLVDKHNPRRIIRALEVIFQSGLSYSSFLNQKSEDNKRGFNIIPLQLDIPREALYKRINNRVDLMVQEGLVQEAKSLITYSQNRALQTVGYQELFKHFNGELSLEQAIEEIKKNSRRYAKRQLTWLRKMELNCFNPKDLDTIKTYVEKHFT